MPPSRLTVRAISAFASTYRARPYATLALALLLASSCARTQPDDDQTRAALTTLSELARRDHASLGFETPDEALRAVLGDPIEVVWLDDKDIEQSVRASDLDRDRRGTEWLYPVLVSGNPRCLIAFERAGRGWTPSAFGYPALARAVSRLRATLPPDTSARLARSYHGDFILLVYPAPDGASMAISLTSPDQARPRPLADELRDALALWKREEEPPPAGETVRPE